MNEDLTLEKEVGLLRLQVDFMIKELLNDHQKDTLSGIVSKNDQPDEEVVDGGTF